MGKTKSGVKVRSFPSQKIAKGGDRKKPNFSNTTSIKGGRK